MGGAPLRFRGNDFAAALVWTDSDGVEWSAERADCGRACNLSQSGGAS